MRMLDKDPTKRVTANEIVRICTSTGRGLDAKLEEDHGEEENMDTEQCKYNL